MTDGFQPAGPLMTAQLAPWGHYPAASPPPAVEVRLVFMTPAWAAAIMAATSGYPERPLVRVRVARIRGAIGRGEWEFDASPVKISKAGRRIDGQHRLQAIAESEEIPGVWLLLALGLEEAAQLVMDAGKARTFQDYLTIQQVADARSKAAVTQLLWSWHCPGTEPPGLFDWAGEWFSRPMATNQQLWTLFSARREQIEVAQAVSRRVLRSVRISGAVAGGAWCILSSLPDCAGYGPADEDAEEFFSQLTLDSAPCAGVLKLQKLMNAPGRAEKKKALVASYAQRVQLALIIKAWNKYRDGDPSEQLKFTVGGAKPEKFPLPH